LLPVFLTFYEGAERETLVSKSNLVGIQKKFASTIIKSNFITTENVSQLHFFRSLFGPL
jgi:hypothetical protein